MGGGGAIRKIQNWYSMLTLLPFIAQCTSHASVSSLKILLGYIENLKALIRPQDSQTKNGCEELLIFKIYPLQ